MGMSGWIRRCSAARRSRRCSPCSCCTTAASSRDKLVAFVADSEIMHGRKNLYGIWAMLRRALTLPSGECPYLIRQQQGLRLDASLLTSDVAQLETCRTLLEQRPDTAAGQVYSQVNDRFSDDLLPSENGNDALASLRVDYRNRLVDALVAAFDAPRRCRRGPGGIWFARAAPSATARAKTPTSASCRPSWPRGSVRPLETCFAAASSPTSWVSTSSKRCAYRSIIETETEPISSDGRGTNNEHRLKRYYGYNYYIFRFNTDVRMRSEEERGEPSEARYRLR